MIESLNNIQIITEYERYLLETLLRRALNRAPYYTLTLSHTLSLVAQNTLLHTLKKYFCAVTKKFCAARHLQCMSEVNACAPQAKNFEGFGR